MNRFNILTATFAVAILLILGFDVGRNYKQDHSPAPTMPTTVDVNGISWRIQTVPMIGKDNTTTGYTNCAMRRIFIVESSSRKRTVLMHELSHAAVCVGPELGFIVNNLYYNSETNVGHEGIYNYADIWSELLTRNPQLGAYLGSQQ